MWVALLLCCTSIAVCTILRNNGMIDAIFDDERRNTRLILFTLISNHIECIKKCLLHTQCKSININSDEGICELVDKSLSRGSFVASGEYNWLEPL